MAFPKFEDWQAPWEKSDETFDEDLARKRIYDLEKDKSVKTDKVTEAAETIKTLKAENAELTKASETAKREGETETQRLERELADSKAKLEESAKSTRENDLLKVRLETGLSEKQVSRLVGDDFDALLADAKEYAEENGVKLLGDESDDEEEVDATKVRRNPVRVTSALDPKLQEPVFDIQKAIDGIPR